MQPVVVWFVDVLACSGAGQAAPPLFVARNFAGRRLNFPEGFWKPEFPE